VLNIVRYIKKEKRKKSPFFFIFIAVFAVRGPGADPDRCGTGADREPRGCRGGRRRRKWRQRGRREERGRGRRRGRERWRWRICKPAVFRRCGTSKPSFTFIRYGTERDGGCVSRLSFADAAPRIYHLHLSGMVQRGMENV
jgi:hypothetical protein